MINLTTVYPVTLDTLHFLYDLLSKREEGVSISHTKMPSWNDHLDFVCSMPYRKWWLIEGERWRLGAAYITKKNEIGIEILQAYQRQGFGRDTLLKIIEMFPGERFLANISPKNERSQKFFEVMGFGLKQQTYEFIPPQ